MRAILVIVWKVPACFVKPHGWVQISFRQPLCAIEAGQTWTVVLRKTGSDMWKENVIENVVLSFASGWSFYLFCGEEPDGYLNEPIPNICTTLVGGNTHKCAFPFFEFWRIWLKFAVHFNGISAKDLRTSSDKLTVPVFHTTCPSWKGRECQLSVDEQMNRWTVKRT